MSTVLNSLSSKWQVSLAPVSGEGVFPVPAVTPPPPQAFRRDGRAAWRTKSSREKQCRAGGHIKRMLISSMERQIYWTPKWQKKKQFFQKFNDIFLPNHPICKLDIKNLLLIWYSYWVVMCHWRKDCLKQCLLPFIRDFLTSAYLLPNLTHYFVSTKFYNCPALTANGHVTNDMQVRQSLSTHSELRSLHQFMQHRRTFDTYVHNLC